MNITAELVKPEDMRKRCCCNCGNRIKENDPPWSMYTKCAIDGHKIGYVECFEGWCRRWRKERKHE